MASLTMATAVMMVALFLFTTTTTITEAQSTDCATKLYPCFDYLNTTNTPPATCCNPIKEAVTNELDCLCNLYNSPTLLQTLNFTITQALNLTRRCSVNDDLSACNKTGASAPNATPTPENGGIRVTWTGVSSLVLLLAASLFI